MLTASCHCGAIQLQITEPLKSLTECNCSICRRYGARWTYHTQKTVHMTYSPDAVTAYVWNDKVIEFYHCNTCGCLTHYEDIDKTPECRVAVNARMLPPAELTGLPIRVFDGASM